MGVDVGTPTIHCEITQWIFDPSIQSNDLNLNAIAHVLNVVTVREFPELDQLMKQYNIRYCVIDANPETRNSLEFAQRHWGKVSLCYYGPVNGKNIHEQTEHKITVHRTSWMDLALGRFHNETIELPYDIDNEYKKHIKAPVRSYEKDQNGNPVGRYQNYYKDDHYAHARTYNEIALQLGASLAVSENIGEDY